MHIIKKMVQLSDYLHITRLSATDGLFLRNEVNKHAYLSIISISSWSLGFIPHFVSMRRHTCFKPTRVETYSFTYK